MKINFVEPSLWYIFFCQTFHNEINFVDKHLEIVLLWIIFSITLVLNVDYHYCDLHMTTILF
jgi:hypothetical protein